MYIHIHIIISYGSVRLDCINNRMDRANIQNCGTPKPRLDRDEQLTFWLLIWGCAGA